MGIIKYIKDATREIHHVAWPTHKETKKYMIIVTTTIIISTIFIYLLSIVFENSFFALRNYVQGNETSTTITETTSKKVQDLVDSGAIKVETGNGTTVNVKAESSESDTIDNKTISSSETSDKKDNSVIPTK